MSWRRYCSWFFLLLTNQGYSFHFKKQYIYNSKLLLKLSYKFVIYLLLLPVILSGQSTFQPKQVDLELKGVVYRKETAVDFRLHTNGIAIALNMGKIQTYDKTNYLHFEIGYIKDPREKKQNKNLSFGPYGQSSSFAFGKLNHMLVLRGGWGKRKFLSEKAKRKGLAVGYNYEFGPALGLLKPYYLELQYKLDIDGKIVTEVRNERYSGDNASKFLNYDEVYGGGGFFKGFKELSFTPGIQGKGSMFFALGAFDKYIKTIEAGIMVDIFVKKMAIMAETENISNKPYFVNLYVSLQLGKRKN